MSWSYLHLPKALGGEDGGIFDPMDPSVQKSMLSLLRELNALLSTYELNTMDMLHNKYRTWECLRQQVTARFSTQKSGSIQPSKQPDQNTMAHLNLLTELPIRFYIDSVPHVKCKKYLCVTQ